MTDFEPLTTEQLGTLRTEMRNFITRAKQVGAACTLVISMKEDESGDRMMTSVMVDVDPTSGVDPVNFMKVCLHLVDHQRANLEQAVEKHQAAFKM